MKRLLLFIAIAVTIGIGIIALRPQQAAAPDTQESTQGSGAEQEISEKPTEETIRAVIGNIIGSQFNAATAKYTLTNLDQRGGFELIVGAIEDVQDPFSRPINATIHVVSFQDSTQQYDRIGSVTYQEWMRGIPEVKELKDVTGDGHLEIIASLMYGGASNSAEGILQIDFTAKKLHWLRLKTQDGQDADAIFQIGGSSGHWNSVEFKNLDTDAAEELVEIYAQAVPFEDQDIQCEVYVSKWDGLQFVYSTDISAQVLTQLNENCQL